MNFAYLVATLHFLPFGPRSQARLFAHFGSAEVIWHASLDELRQSGVDQQRLASFVTWRQDKNPQDLYASVPPLGLEIVIQSDDRYPTLLKTLIDPPVALFVKGKLPPPYLPLLSVVGSRHHTGYGKTVARSLSGELVRRGLGIVSGLAMGIDEIAHQAALDQGGYTLGVIAQGHGSNLSDRQKRLMSAIVAKGGGVMSEYPPPIEPQKFSFPIRNRIIAGLSRGTLVIEAGLPSGTLITAQAAIDNNRELFAVPGPIDSANSAGANQLIKDGAHVVRNADDVTDVLGLSSTPRHMAVASPFPPPLMEGVSEAPEGGQGEADGIFAILARGPAHIDDLAREADRPTTELLAALTYLELDGKVRNLGNMYFSL